MKKILTLLLYFSLFAMERENPLSGANALDYMTFWYSHINAPANCTKDTKDEAALSNREHTLRKCFMF